ncbi:hypothetical protein ACF0H5_016465 [Mactra antiquata]
MRVVIAFVCLIGVVLGESCDGTDTTTCANEICADGFVPTCVSTICTCNPAPKPSECTTVSECSSYWTSHHCSNNHRQCVGGKCACVHGHGR